MAMFMRVFLMISVLALGGCGGSGGGGDKSSSRASNASIVSSIPASNGASSQDSAASSSISSIELPSDFPIGTAESLPRLSISTESGAPVTSRDDYLQGEFTLQDLDGSNVAGALEIRGRGNSTWDWDKKPYRLKLASSTALLDMPASKHWVLLANYADKTLMRNDIAFMFSNSIGMEYTPRARHVEVQMNGVYQGVYQLVENIRIADDRVNIPELKLADNQGENVTGGYLLEIDFRYHKDFCLTAFYEDFCVNGVNTNRDVDFCIDSAHGMPPFCLQNPETLLEPEWSAQRRYIEEYFAQTEAALFGENFKDPTLGYAAKLDVESVIDYYLINEFFKNPDGMEASAYVYKKRNGKFFFGPIWDFDLAMGNAGYNNVEQTSGWHTRNSPWIAQLFRDPAFEAQVKARWQTLKAERKFELLFVYMRARATWLETQQQKNYQLWSITDFAPWIAHGKNGGTGSYAAEVNELIRWQRERYQWMDAQFSK